MKGLNQGKVALIAGTFTALIHIFWAGLVAFGLAQGLLDFIYSVHFLNNPFAVAQFNITTAVVLTAFTFVVGYIFGYLFAYLWNYLHNK